jgi:DNA protecting protein DprA
MKKQMPQIWIALNSVKGLGPVKIKALLEKYGTAEAAFERLSDELPALAGNVPEVNKKVLLEQARRQLDRARELDVRVLTLADEDYPPHLKEIYAPPPVLFVKGSCDVFKKHSIAIVGTRRYTPYGKSVTMTLVKELVQKHLVIVSGLAQGIDTIAHQTCLENKGETIAVLGCGIDTCYPKENKQLSQQIMSAGAVVSEFPLGTQPESFNFPRRNRIISGLSAGVVVMEAPVKSGSLITANYALQQGRDVFAVPGSIFSAGSMGPFNLIKDGAIPVMSAHDIVDSIQIISHSAITGPRKAFPGLEGTMKMPLDLLSSSERKVFDGIAESPARIDAIAEKSGKTISEMFDLLLSLELKGFIKQVSGQQYLRV